MPPASVKGCRKAATCAALDRVKNYILVNCLQAGAVHPAGLGYVQEVELMKRRNVALKFSPDPLKLKKIRLFAVSALARTPLVGVMSFASDSSGAVSATAWQSVITALTSQISVSTVVGVLASLVTAGIGLVFMWWGVRKAVRSLMAAFRRGKMSL